MPAPGAWRSSTANLILGEKQLSILRRTTEAVDGPIRSVNPSGSSRMRRITGTSLAIVVAVAVGMGMMGPAHVVLVVARRISQPRLDIIESSEIGPTATTTTTTGDPQSQRRFA